MPLKPPTKADNVGCHFLTADIVLSKKQAVELVLKALQQAEDAAQQLQLFQILDLTGAIT